jgi:putative ubiquitin-RnfH superfamily antitoxin RatB of RatAB toxin-antitoxin module
MHVEVVYCPGPGRVDLVGLDLPPGSTLGHALQASGVLARHGLAAGDVHVGIWGREQAQDAPLRERDRVEVYRPLQVDPKEARRLRYRRREVSGSPKR